MAKKKYIETPEKMWELFVKYRTHVKKTPRLKMVFVGKDGNKTYEELERPLTMEGFSLYGYDNNLTIHHYFENPEGAYDEYRGICTRVRANIREDQVSGGMVGQYNASITQRLNGLSDKQEVKQETTIRDLTIEIVDTNIPLAGAEKDIQE
jgi:hypothetical protein